MEQKYDSKWDWVTCNYHLKTEINAHPTTWNLSPQIILTNPQQDGPDPNVRLFIDTEKSLEYSNEIGWSWHKSWNLPNISVRLEIKDPNTGELLLAPKNLYVQLNLNQFFVVLNICSKSGTRPLRKFSFSGCIRGVNKIELIDGHAFFTALKFSSTSYNNEGVKFHLVLALYIINDDNSQPQVLNSTISPPIFVDSRKQAKDEKKMSSFVEPFLPETLEKTYIKRENKKKNDAEIQIINNFEGLYSYLTAPNIRHKVKHPLFLFLKFTECVKLYYNQKDFPELNLKVLIETLQKQIYQDHQYKQIGSGNTKLDDKHFILQIADSNDTYKNKKIVEAMEPLQCASLGILYHFQSTPPSDFLELSSVRNEILNFYKQVQGSLYCSEHQNEKEEESSEDEKDDEVEEKIIKKVHLDEQSKNNADLDEDSNEEEKEIVNGEQEIMNFEINNEKGELNQDNSSNQINNKVSKATVQAVSNQNINQLESEKDKLPAVQQITQQQQLPSTSVSPHESQQQQNQVIKNQQPIIKQNTNQNAQPNNLINNTQEELKKIQPQPPAQIPQQLQQPQQPQQLQQQQQQQQQQQPIQSQQPQLQIKAQTLSPIQTQEQPQLLQQQAQQTAQQQQFQQNFQTLQQQQQQNAFNPNPLQPQQNSYEYLMRLMQNQQQPSQIQPQQQIQQLLNQVYQQHLVLQNFQSMNTNPLYNFNLANYQKQQQLMTLQMLMKNKNEPQVQNQFDQMLMQLQQQQSNPNQNQWMNQYQQLQQQIKGTPLGLNQFFLNNQFMPQNQQDVFSQQQLSQLQKNFQNQFSQPHLPQTVPATQFASQQGMNSLNSILQNLQENQQQQANINSETNVKKEGNQNDGN